MSKKLDYEKVDKTCRSLADKEEQIQYLIEVARNNDIDEPLEFAQITLQDLHDIWAEEQFEAFYGDSLYLDSACYEFLHRRYQKYTKRLEENLADQKIYSTL